MNPEMPELTVQQQCELLVDQFYDEFAELRRDVSTAVKDVARTWEGFFPDPSEMHGQLYCTSVRGLLLHSRVGLSNPESEPPAGVVRTRYGSGMSVRISDGRGWFCRVRKAPAEFFPELGERLVFRVPGAQRSGHVEPGDLRGNSKADAEAAANGQLPLDPEMAALPRSAPKTKNYDWFVLWTLSADSLQVPEAFLAAVVDIDSPSQVKILASTPLPNQARPQTVIDDHDDDFTGFFDQKGDEGFGSSPA